MHLQLLTSKRPDAEVKLIDFGLAKETTDNLARSFLGTRGYLAPEMLQRQSYDKSIDIWALGVIVFVLLCGCLPFDDDSSRIANESAARKKFTLRFPRWASTLSVSAKDLLHNLLDVNPKTRFTAEQALNHPWVSGRTVQPNSYLQSPSLIGQLYCNLSECIFCFLSLSLNFQRRLGLYWIYLTTASVSTNCFTNSLYMCTFRFFIWLIIIVNYVCLINRRTTKGAEITPYSPPDPNSCKWCQRQNSPRCYNCKLIYCMKSIVLRTSLFIFFLTGQHLINTYCIIYFMTYRRRQAVITVVLRGIKVSVYPSVLILLLTHTSLAIILIILWSNSLLIYILFYSWIFRVSK